MKSQLPRFRKQVPGPNSFAQNYTSADLMVEETKESGAPSSEALAPAKRTNSQSVVPTLEQGPESLVDG